LRVVLDSNVVLSGFFFAGIPGIILQGWHAGRFRLVLSPSILSEYRAAGVALESRYVLIPRMTSFSRARSRQEPGSSFPVISRSSTSPVGEESRSSDRGRSWRSTSLTFRAGPANEALKLSRHFAPRSLTPVRYAARTSHREWRFQLVRSFRRPAAPGLRSGFCLVWASSVGGEMAVISGCAGRCRCEAA
jgi:hypothetical protein